MRHLEKFRRFTSLNEHRALEEEDTGGFPLIVLWGPEIHEPAGRLKASEENILPFRGVG